MKKSGEESIVSERPSNFFSQKKRKAFKSSRAEMSFRRSISFFPHSEFAFRRVISGKFGYETGKGDAGTNSERARERDDGRWKAGAFKLSCQMFCGIIDGFLSFSCISGNLYIHSTIPTILGLTNGRLNYEQLNKKSFYTKW